MKKRIITAVVLAAVLLPLVIIDHHKHPLAGYLFLGVGILFSIIASFEMISLFYKKYPTIGALRYIIPFMSGSLVYTIYLATTRGLNIGDPIDASIVYHVLTMGLFILYVVIALGFSIFKNHSTAADMMGSVLTLTYCGLVMGFVINIRFLEPFDASELLYFRGGRSFAYLYTIVAATDSFAFFIGSRFGRHKLCPEISPKKTVEGAVAGLIAGSLFGVAASFLFKIARPTGTSETVVIVFATFLVSLLLSFAVQIGDLVASKIKRTFDVKDFGYIFPGHGGVLDRFDSLIFSGAVYYIIVLLVKVVFIWSA
jgi:phosphatidate cytidylyltransferase